MATDRRARNKERSQQAKVERLRAARQRRTRKVVAIVAVMALVALGIGLTFGGISSSSSNSTAKPTTTTAPAPTTTIKPVGGASIKGDTPCPKADGSSAKTTKFEKVPPTCIDPGKKYTADFDTSEGHIVVTLDTTKTPETTNNFVVLARYHYYDGTAVFRIAPGIDIIQSGSPNTQDGTDSPGYSIKDEGSGYTYAEGDLVMARTSEANSAGSQYFFATGPAVSGLNSQGTYVNFGHATSGVDVLHKIKALFKDNGQGQGEGFPGKPVIVNKVTITES